MNLHLMMLVTFQGHLEELFYKTKVVVTYEEAKEMSSTRLTSVNGLESTEGD
jgi:hypothetical protein